MSVYVNITLETAQFLKRYIHYNINTLNSDAKKFPFI